VNLTREDKEVLRFCPNLVAQGYQSQHQVSNQGTSSQVSASCTTRDPYQIGAVFHSSIVLIQHSCSLEKNKGTVCGMDRLLPGLPTSTKLPERSLYLNNNNNKKPQEYYSALKRDEILLGANGSCL
jgi:hypothetical protein